MRVRALLSIVVLVCSAGACTGSAKPVRPRATPGDVLRTDERAPLPFGAKPLWTERAKGVPRYADSFALRGERVVVVSGPKGGEADRLSVLDAASGRVRWSTRIWTPLRGGGGDEVGGAPLCLRRGGRGIRGGRWGRPTSHLLPAPPGPFAEAFGWRRRLERTRWRIVTRAAGARTSRPSRE